MGARATWQARHTASPDWRFAPRRSMFAEWDHPFGSEQMSDELTGESNERADDDAPIVDAKHGAKGSAKHDAKHDAKHASTGDAIAEESAPILSFFLMAAFG